MPLVTTLSFREAHINVRNDQLCLTDMWRAAGSPDSKRPSKWLSSKQARELTAFLEEAHGIQNSDTMGSSGSSQGFGSGGGATWRHWHLGLAYAKYLSPEFHVWCNTVVRAHMEGLNQLALPHQILSTILSTCQELLSSIRTLQAPQLPPRYVTDQQVATLRREARKVAKGPISPLWENIQTLFAFDAGRVFQTVTPDQFTAAITAIRAYKPPPQKVTPIRPPSEELSLSPNQVCTMLKKDLQLDIAPPTLFDLLEMNPDLPVDRPPPSGSSTVRQGFSFQPHQYHTLVTYFQTHRPRINATIKKLRDLAILRHQAPTSKK